MRYDLKLIHELCQELGFHSSFKTDALVTIKLSRDCVLVFQNAKRDEDCLVAFEGTPWHTHDIFMFADDRGYHTEMDYLDVISGLKDGRILVCEQWLEGRLIDRSLIHRDFNDEFKYMDTDEEIRVWRPAIDASKDKTVADTPLKPTAE